MGAGESPFKPLPSGRMNDVLQVLMEAPRTTARAAEAQAGSAWGATTARLHGFDLQDSPLLAGLARFPGELMTARSIVPLHRAMLGATVLVLNEDGDSAQPIIIGILQGGGPVSSAEAFVPAGAANPAVAMEARVDGDRLELTAQREIVLRCGASSITLTRAGKVIIKGNYILSRSAGYNKIKGAAIDIN